MKVLAAAIFVLGLLLGISPAWAQAKMSGSFVASAACPAVVSIHKGTNPGGVTLVTGTSYAITGGNTDNPTYYWIVVPGVTPDHRWVPVTCGSATLDGGTATTDTTNPPPTAGVTRYLLVPSWEPAFCEGLPNKTECQSQTATSFEATHLALHGLWPQPRKNVYCNVSAADQANDVAHAWDSLPAVTLSAGTRADLDKVMPGTQSVLERHEWIKHGTCYGTDQEHYFAAAVSAMSALNTSAVQALFAANIGKTVTLAQIRAAFDTAFGTGAGLRVRVTCDNDGSRRLIGEMTIGLGAPATATSKLGDLILAAAPTDGGCTSGIVDAAGLQ